MVSLIIVIIATFILTNLFGYVVHWALHQSWSGSFNESHMTHHLKLYPANDFLSDVYREAGKDATPKFFVIAAIPLISLPIILYLFGLLSVWVMIISIVEMFTIGLLDNYLHDAFHIKNHWMNKVPIINKYFAAWERLHFLHHVNMNYNFGIFNFMWDKIFSSFWNIDEIKIFYNK